MHVALTRYHTVIQNRCRHAAHKEQGKTKSYQKFIVRIEDEEGWKEVDVDQYKPPF